MGGLEGRREDLAPHPQSQDRNPSLPGPNTVSSGDRGRGLEGTEPRLGERLRQAAGVAPVVGTGREAGIPQAPGKDRPCLAPQSRKPRSQPC